MQVPRYKTAVSNYADPDVGGICRRLGLQCHAVFMSNDNIADGNAAA